MKNVQILKRGLLLILTAVFIASCGTNATVRSSKKVLKGYWNLDEINYGDAQGIYDVTLFKDASSSCFVGSLWRFIPNNNFGNYEISSTDCTAKQQYFVWNIDEQSGGTATNYDILLKPTDEKMNSTMSSQGFRLNINYLSEESLQFTQTVQVDGKPFTITMNFSKIQE
ncbi:MAG: lipocalin family protein [Leeuwenhoekiella sp.]